MDFGWLWCAHVGSSVVTHTGNVDNEGACACVEAGGMWESLYLPFNFSVNLKLPWKVKY